MTRNRDIYIPHRQRFEIAREADADLFISVHADSLKPSRLNNRVRGATVYTLSETASDKEAEALARKENKSDLIAGIDLNGESDEVSSILIDLARRETMNYSAQFASYLVPELKERVYIRKNAHRFAGFLVLKASDVPSVLVEIGYLSNKQDARQLNSAEGRKRISAAIAAAVRRYFESTTAGSF
jgi:N-acetylmuramoyl-L-alanine amidase